MAKDYAESKFVNVAPCVDIHYLEKGEGKPLVEKEMPSTEIFVMGGHLMFYEYPEKWNSVLEEFLGRL